MPEGLEDVSRYPNLFLELAERGWSEEDLGKLAGNNIIRVFKQVEEVQSKIVDSQKLRLPLASIYLDSFYPSVYRSNNATSPTKNQQHNRHSEKQPEATGSLRPW